jgi:hypothetical protein
MVDVELMESEVVGAGAHGQGTRGCLQGFQRAWQSDVLGISFGPRQNRGGNQLTTN